MVWFFRVSDACLFGFAPLSAPSRSRYGRAMSYAKPKQKGYYHNADPFWLWHDLL